MELTMKTPETEIPNATLWACGRTLAAAGKVLIPGMLMDISRDQVATLVINGREVFAPSHVWVFAYRSDAKAVAYGEEKILAVRQDWLQRTFGAEIR